MRIKAGRLLKNRLNDLIETLPDEKKKRYRKYKKEVDYHTRYKRKKQKSFEFFIECIKDDEEEDKEL